MADGNKLPWSERVTMLSIHPDAATRDDVARLASELTDAKMQIIYALDGIDGLLLTTDNKPTKEDFEAVKKVLQLCAFLKEFPK